ncbi:MAG: Rrf2 family transcriptional regulator [Holophagaceae bacterium]|nr:Rrf2 family transcriptional regulator [Holophagaceae bacterium]
MIGIGRHTDYAARLVLHLASLAENTQVTIAEIAEERMLPVAFVRRLIGPLSSAGILTTVVGAKGGVRLGRHPSEITLLDLVNAMEGGITLNHCVGNEHTCPLSSHCPVQSAWAGATRSLEESLASVTFEALAHGAEGHAQAHQERHDLLAKVPTQKGRRHARV